MSEEKTSWDEVQKGLRELSGEMGAMPPELEGKMRRRFRASARERSRVRWAWAVAAALAVGVGLSAWFSQVEPPPALVEAPVPSGEFLMLEYGRPTRELTAGRLVRVTLPPSAPAWFGLPVDPAARDGIEAEVLLGDDGVAQAVRLVHQR